VGGDDVGAEKCWDNILTSHEPNLSRFVGLIARSIHRQPCDKIEGHMANLRIVFERMKGYNLKMNPLKCAFRVSNGRFLGFIVHERGIEVDPKKVTSIKKIQEPMCKRDI
jgi:hypothetical protein